MSTPILTTRLFVPPLWPKVVRRPRLVARLNEDPERKLTLISAAAGFGKTTLVSEWVAGCDRPVAWLSLDNGHNDRSQFLTYLVAALKTISKELGNRVSALLLSPEPPDIETILTTLLNEIAVFSDNFILVLDDYHVIDSKPVDDALAFLLANLPPKMHLVIATREDPPLPLARMRARGQMTELRARDLRFTPSESAAFLNKAMDLNLKEQVITALETRTEGWVAGLQLAAISMQGHEDPTDFIKSFTGSHSFVLDYLVEEVLGQQPEHVQTFLLRTSILNRMCGPLCDAVLDAPLGSGQETLQYLEQANLFIVPLDNERRWYRYHHLFGELLRQRAQQATNSIAGDKVGNVAQSHLRASRWFEENGLAEDAIHHAFRAEDYERAADLIEPEWPILDGRFQSGIWLEWAKALPDELIRARPVLSADYGWALLDKGEVEASESRFNDAEEWLELVAEKGEHQIGMVVVDKAQFRSLPSTIAIARAYVAQALGNVSGTVRHAQQALKVIPEEDHLSRGQVASLLGIAYWAKGDLEAAFDSATDGTNSMRKAGYAVFATSSAILQAYILECQGRLFDAKHIYEETLKQGMEQGETALGIVGSLHLDLVKVHHEQGNLEAAEQHLQKSRELSEQAAFPDWAYRWCRVQARIKEARGDLKGALEQLEKAEGKFFRGPLPDFCPVAAQRVRVWLKQGRLTDALKWVQTRNLSVTDDLCFLSEFEHITLARVLISAHGNKPADSPFQDAVKFLGKLLTAAEDGGRTGSAIEILVLRSLTHQVKGDTSLALETLELALVPAAREGYVRIFLDEGNPMAALLSEAAAQGIVPDYTSTLLDAFETDKPLSEHKPVQPQSTPSKPLVEPLSRRELEVLQLLAGGLSNREIGERLYVSVSTVKGHNSRIFGKLGVKRRTEAIARARELGLLDLKVT